MSNKTYLNFTDKAKQALHDKRFENIGWKHVQSIVKYVQNMHENKKIEPVRTEGEKNFFRIDADMLEMICGEINVTVSKSCCTPEKVLTQNPFATIKI